MEKPGIKIADDGDGAGNTRFASVERQRLGRPFHSRRYQGQLGATVCGQVLNLLLRVDQLIGQQVQGLARRRWQIGPVTCHEQAFDVMNAFGDDTWRGVRACPHETLRGAVEKPIRPQPVRKSFLVAPVRAAGRRAAPDPGRAPRSARSMHRARKHERCSCLDRRLQGARPGGGSGAARACGPCHPRGRLCAERFPKVPFGRIGRGGFPTAPGKRFDRAKARRARIRPNVRASRRMRTGAGFHADEQGNRIWN